MAIGNSRDRFIDQITLAAAVCVILTGIYWIISKFNDSAINLLSVFGGFVTIVGFYVAIEQLAQLRREKEVISDTRVEDKLEDTKEILINMQTQLVNSVISVDLINGWILALRSVQRKITHIKQEGCLHINCDKFSLEIDDIVVNLNNDISVERIKIFSRPVYDERIQALLTQVIFAEKQMKI